MKAQSMCSFPPMEANFDSDSSSGRLTETEPIFKTARSALPARETATLRIIKKGTGGEAYIGGLVGYASQANVSDLSVKNLRIEVVADVEAWKTSPAIGGIFGYGSQLNMSRSSVDGFACALFQPTFVNEKYPSQNTRIHFGGLVAALKWQSLART